jgi:hypothetical protein
MWTVNSTLLEPNDIEIVRQWARIQKLTDVPTGEAGDEDCDTHTWILKDFREYHHKVADDKYIGVGEPPYEETKVIDMPHGGLVATIYRALESMGRIFWAGALAFQKIVWGAMDTFFEWAGFGANFWSRATYFLMLLPNMIVEFVAQAGNFVDWIISIANYMFNFIGVTITRVITFLGWIVNVWIRYARGIISLFTGGWTNVGDIWTQYSMEDWIVLFLTILYPYYQIKRWYDSDDPFQTMMEDIRTYISWFNGLISFFMRMTDYIMKMINIIIQALPI